MSRCQVFENQTQYLEQLIMEHEIQVNESKME